MSPENLKEYKDEWNKFLKKLPKDFTKKNMPNFDHRFEQAEHWLQSLSPKISRARASDALEYLQNFYNECMAILASDSNLSKQLFSSILNDTYSKGIMSDGAFGYFLPGYPVSLRTRKFLEESIHFAERLIQYKKHILPKIVAGLEYIDKAGIPLSTTAKLAYAKSFEKSLIQELFFKKNTQKAIPLHGFFPYDMPELEKQDRIIALTSVSMHGWNSLDEKGFKEDIEKGISFLKVGGEYILGPINQYVHFGSVGREFDSEALNKALQKLKQQGMIDYYYVKKVNENPIIRRNYNSDKEEEDDIEIKEEKDGDITDVLKEYESAYSLVITRLK